MGGEKLHRRLLPLSILGGAALLLVACLLLYTAWNFYEKAISFDPLAEVSVRKIRQKEAEKPFADKFKPAWSKVIFEKNLFSPGQR